MRNNQSGVALIFALGILTLLLVLGVAFVANMAGDNRITEDFVRSLRTRLAAQAGLERAFAELRQHAQSIATEHSNEAWYGTQARPSYDTGAGVSGTLTDGTQYIMRITDGGSRIDLNAGSDNELVRMLERLPGLNNALAWAIVNYRNTLPGQKYFLKKQLVLANAALPGLYNQFKDFVTTHAYRDPNAAQDSGQVTGGTSNTLQDSSKAWSSNVHQGSRVFIYAGQGVGQERIVTSNTNSTLTVNSVWDENLDATSRYTLAARAPVNVNTASDEVLTAVLDPVGGVGFIAALNSIRPISTWTQFDSVVSGAPARNNANPNRTKPANGSTEFAFNGGGLFEVEATGRVLNPGGGNPLAEQTLSWTTHVYDIWSESKKWQWAESPEFYRVTWSDSCPTDLTFDTQIDFPATYPRVADSLKIGYWDDFEEDPSYSTTMWSTDISARPDLSAFDLTGGEMQFTNSNPAENKGNFGQFLLAYKGPTQQAVTDSEDTWNFNDFFLRVTNRDDPTIFGNPFTGEGDVGRIRFRSSGVSGAASFAYARNKGLKYVLNTNTGVPPDTYTQEYIFEIVDSNGNPTGNYQESGTKYTGRQFTPPGNFGVVQDLDGVPMKIPPNEKGMAQNPPPDDNNKPDPTDLAFYIRFISKVVFVLGDNGPDRVHGETDGSGNYYPYYLYPYTYTNPGSITKAYRLLARDVRSTANKAQAVSMTVQDATDTHVFPGVGLGDGEIDTFIRRAGILGLMGNAMLPAWDNIRVISPDGNMRSGVWDAGQSVRLGTVSWTNSAADETLETISVDVRASADLNMTGVSWSYNPVVLPGSPPEITRGISTGQSTSSGAPIGNSTGRYLQYRVYLETNRAYQGTFGDPYLKTTPILEDISVTYLPRGSVLATHIAD